MKVMLFSILMCLVAISCGSELRSVADDEDTNNLSNSTGDTDTDTDSDSDSDGDGDADSDGDADTDSDTDTDTDGDSDSDGDADTDSDADGDFPSNCNKTDECYGSDGCMECAKQGICKDRADACRSDADCAAYETCTEDCREQNEEIIDFIKCRVSCTNQWPAAAEKYQSVIDCVFCLGCMSRCSSDASQGDCNEWDTDPHIDTETEIIEDPPWDPINPDDSTGLAEIGGSGQSGHTTRYWDCCKPSCGWPNNTGGKNPITCCTQSDSVHSNAWNGQSSCSGGDVYTCWDNSPWAVNTKLSYGFVAVQAGSGQFSCGECLQFEFGGNLEGKTMVVQVTNIGTDVAASSFDIMVPGGGVGLFDGCSKQWGVSKDQLGETYGGFLTTCLNSTSSIREAIECTNSKCDSIFSGKDKLKRGCRWFTNWFRASNNPSVTYKKIACPQEILSISGLQ